MTDYGVVEKWAVALQFEYLRFAVCGYGNEIGSMIVV